MITRALCLALFAAPAVPALADERLSAEDFAEYATGYTLYYEDENGDRFGSETFDDKGFVTWRAPNGQCIRGGWRAYNDDLCFLYEGEVHCWAFFEGATGRYVRPVGEDEPKLRVVRRDQTPLSCGGPEFDL